MKSLLPVILPLLVAACGAGHDATSSSASDLRALSEPEVLDDLEELGAAIRASYGPLEFKRGVGFDLDRELALARAQVHAGKTEGERMFALYQLTGHLKDIHVSLVAPATARGSAVNSDGAASRSLPFSIVPVEDGKYAVYGVGNAARGKLFTGDLVTSFDGVAPADLEKTLATYMDFVTPTTTRARWASALVNRPAWAPAALQPHGPTAQIGIQHANGTEVVVELPWAQAPDFSQLVAQLVPPATPPTPASPLAAPVAPQLVEELAREEAVVGDLPAADAAFPPGNAPFFYGTTVATKFGMVPVKPSVAFPTVLDLGAFKYSYGGKTLLFIRIPGYAPADMNANLDWIRTLLLESQQGAADDPDVAKRPIDAVILDETRNGGGHPNYAQGIASMFLTAPIPGDSMSYRADRNWLASFDAHLRSNVSPVGKKFWGDVLLAAETAIDRNATVTPIFRDVAINYGNGIAVGDEAYGPTITPHPKGGWTGPTLVLVDARSASAADMFPMLMQNGGVAKIFGTQTSGAGGMVQALMTLPNSGYTFNCTRGFFGAYSPDGSQFRYIENNGVVPDYPHPLTLADTRDSFVGYVKHFSDVASTLTR